MTDITTRAWVADADLDDEVYEADLDDEYGETSETDDEADNNTDGDTDGDPYEFKAADGDPYDASTGSDGYTDQFGEVVEASDGDSR